MKKVSIRKYPFLEKKNQSECKGLFSCIVRVIVIKISTQKIRHATDKKWHGFGQDFTQRWMRVFVRTQFAVPYRGLLACCTYSLLYKLAHGPYKNLTTSDVSLAASI
jgi:hypothetical protein